MKFFPDLGNGPLVAAPAYDSPVRLPAGWSFSLKLCAGFEPSSFTVCVSINMLRAMKVNSARHSIELPVINGIIPHPTRREQDILTTKRFSGFVLSDLAIVDDTYAITYQKLLQQDAITGVRRPAVPDQDPNTTNDLIGQFDQVLLAIDKYLGASAAWESEPMIALHFRDLRWWWKEHSAVWDHQNGFLGQVVKVPAGIKNLLYETPYRDPSYTRYQLDNPPQTYPGQHDEVIYNDLNVQQKAAIDLQQKKAYLHGGLLADTNQLNSRPFVVQRPSTDEGARPLSWRETLLSLIANVGALWKYDPNGTENNLVTLIDPTGFRAPTHPHGPPQLNPTDGNAWFQLVRFLHGTGHTLEPLAWGGFKIVEVAIDSDTALYNSDVSYNTLDQLLAFTATNSQQRPTKYSILPQIPTTPLPDMVKVSYEPSPGESQWRRLGRQILSRGKTLPHALISTEWLLNRIHKSPYPLPVLNLAGAALSRDFASADLANHPLPKLPRIPNRGTLDVFAPISPSQPFVAPVDGDDLSKPITGGLGDNLWEVEWTPPGGTQADPKDPVPVRYAQPQTTDTNYDNPSWLLYPKPTTPLSIPGSLPPKSITPQAMPSVLFPLAKYAQQQLLRELIPTTAVRFAGHINVMPDRYCRCVSFDYHRNQDTEVIIGVASLPESVWERPSVMDPPEVLFVQATKPIPKNLTALQTVKVIHPAQTQNALDGWFSPERVVALTNAIPTIYPGAKPLETPTGNPTTPPPTTNPSLPYWRVEESSLVIENLSGRGIREQELFVVHRGVTDNYQILPCSGATLAVAKATKDFLETDTHYEADIVKDYRNGRIHSASTPEYPLYEDPVVAKILVLNVNHRMGSAGDKALVSLAGQLPPWIEAAEAAENLERPLAEATLSYQEIWEEITIPSTRDNVRKGLVQSYTAATWDNDRDALTRGTLRAWPFVPDFYFPHHEEIVYSKWDRIYLTADDHDPALEYAKDDWVLIGEKIYRAKAVILPKAFEAADWDLLGEQKLHYAKANIPARKFTPSDWEVEPEEDIDFIDRTGDTVLLVNRLTDDDVEEGSLVYWIGVEVIVLSCKPVAGYEPKSMTP